MNSRNGLTVNGFSRSYLIKKSIALIIQIIISSFFDIANYDHPINYFLDDSYLAIEYGRTQYNSLYYKRGLLKLFDNFIGFFNDDVNDLFY